MTGARQKKHNLLLSFCACFCAIQAGALVVCIGLMLEGVGLGGFFEGAGLWAIGQFVILPLALVSMPVGALVRTVLSLTFENPKLVALTAGTVVGTFGALLVGIGHHGDPTSDFAYLMFLTLLGGTSGFVGGWVWWRIEKPLWEGSHR